MAAASDASICEHGPSLLADPPLASVMMAAIGLSGIVRNGIRPA